MSTSLPQIIQINKDRCVNCHACISVCPIKLCNDGSKDIIDVNHDMCVGCGQCLEACTHGARVGIDDSTKFFSDLESGIKMVAIVAPAIAANFPDSYLKINSWLKSIGVKAVFDVSFGAELTVKSYIDHLNKHGTKTLIAQPCPVLVHYIQMYHPELLKHLAPKDSPMLHIIKYIKHFHPEFTKHKIVAISPCLAKTREFFETGYGDYNVTFTSIANHLKLKNIDLNNYPKQEFDSPFPERGVLFSSPGGLLQTAMRDVPGIEKRTRKIEGPEHIFHYLEKLKDDIIKGNAPLLIDCLNCSLGCNGGTGTPSKQKTIDELEKNIEKRKNKLVQKDKNLPFFSKSKLKKQMEKAWLPDLYNRSYKDLSHLISTNQVPEDQQRAILHDMGKEDLANLLNCGHCGYSSCKEMANAIYNNLNKAENCFQYREQLLSKAQTQAEESMNKIKQSYENNKHLFSIFSRTIKEVNDNIEDAIDRISTLQGLSSNQEHAFSLIAKEVESMGNEITHLEKMITGINKIAENTNLISLNASIEAANAGRHGITFSVVAEEIKKLASNSQEKVSKVSPFVTELKEVFKKVKENIQKSPDMMSATKELISILESGNRNLNQTVTSMVNESKSLMQEEEKLNKLI